MHEEENLICMPCGVPLQRLPVQFSYLGHTFDAEAPRCPQCGQVYLSYKLVSERIAEAETELEDK